MNSHRTPHIPTADHDAEADAADVEGYMLACRKAGGTQSMGWDVKGQDHGIIAVMPEIKLSFILPM